MRAVSALVCTFALAWLVFACEAPIDQSTSCGRAKEILAECGVMLPLLESDNCTGTAEAVSDCIVTTNGSCDALATLGSHIEQCISTEGGSPIPTDFPAVRADAASSLDASPLDAPADAASHLEAGGHATPPPVAPGSVPTSLLATQP